MNENERGGALSSGRCSTGQLPPNLFLSFVTAVSLAFLSLLLLFVSRLGDFAWHRSVTREASGIDGRRTRRTFDLLFVLWTYRCRSEGSFVFFYVCLLLLALSLLFPLSFLTWSLSSLSFCCCSSSFPFSLPVSLPLFLSLFLPLLTK